MGVHNYQIQAGTAKLINPEAVGRSEAGRRCPQPLALLGVDQIFDVRGQPRPALATAQT
jgi:hypothetical protein